MVPLTACRPQVETMSKFCQVQPGTAKAERAILDYSAGVSRPLWAALASGRATGPGLSRELFGTTGAKSSRFDHIRPECSIARDQTDVLTHPHYVMPHVRHKTVLYGPRKPTLWDIPVAQQSIGAS